MLVIKNEKQKNVYLKEISINNLRKLLKKHYELFHLVYTYTYIDTTYEIRIYIKKYNLFIGYFCMYGAK